MRPVRRAESRCLYLDVVARPFNILMFYVECRKSNRDISVNYNASREIYGGVLSIFQYSFAIAYSQKHFTFYCMCPVLKQYVHIAR